MGEGIDEKLSGNFGQKFDKKNLPSVNSWNKIIFPNGDKNVKKKKKD